MRDTSSPRFLLILAGLVGSFALVWGAWKHAPFVDDRSDTSTTREHRTDTAADAIAWRFDMTAALAQAQQQGKLVVIDFYADWCPPCKKMERTTFQDTRVKRQLESYIPVKINVEQQRSVAQRYGIRGLPTSLVLAASGKPLTGRTGYLNAEMYLALLDHASQQASPNAG